MPSYAPWHNELSEIKYGNNATVGNVYLHNGAHHVAVGHQFTYNVLHVYPLKNDLCAETMAIFSACTGVALADLTAVQARGQPTCAVIITSAVDVTPPASLEPSLAAGTKVMNTISAQMQMVKAVHADKVTLADDEEWDLDSTVAMSHKGLVLAELCSAQVKMSSKAKRISFADAAAITRQQPQTSNADVLDLYANADAHTGLLRAGCIVQKKMKRRQKTLYLVTAVHDDNETCTCVPLSYQKSGMCTFSAEDLQVVPWTRVPHEANELISRIVSANF